jgi:hypothetical protein
MSGGGGGAPQAQQVTSTTSNLPEYARPYFENLMNRAQAESYREYTPYEGQRLAGFTPEQQQVQQQTMGLQTPGQFGAASNFASAAGLGSLAASQYTPTSFNNQQIGQPNLLNYQMSTPSRVTTQNYSAPQMQAAQTNFAPNIQHYDMNAAQTNFDASSMLQQHQMDRPDMFGQAQVDQYMSPYIQNVLDVQKREALTDAKKAQLAQNLGAVRQGSYGGARQLLATTERERALGQQLGDIQARGLQSAFENSQQQFERDRTAGMSADSQNLQARLQTQGLGANLAQQVALANLSSEQQARVQNQAARMQAQELSVNTGLQTALANLSAQQQANVQNQAAALQTQGLNAEQALRAALANQQADLTVGQQNLNASLDTQRLGATTGLQALLANQQTNLEAQRLGEQSRQFGATTQLQGLGQVLESGRTLGNLGLTQQQADLQRLQAQSATAGQQQQLTQQQLDMAYADFLRQRDYPMEQLGYYGNLLRGVPVQLGSTATTYAQPPSMGAQVGGLGLGALGMYNMAQG